MKKFIVILLLATSIVSGCGNKSIEQDKVQAVSLYATDTDKYDNFRMYNNTFSYSLPYDVSEDDLGWDLVLKSFYQDHYEDWSDKWNWYVYSHYYMPTYWYTRYMEDENYTWNDYSADKYACVIERSK